MSNHQAMTIRDYLEARHPQTATGPRAGRANPSTATNEVFNRMLQGQKSAAGQNTGNGLTAADYRAAAVAPRRHNTTPSPLKNNQAKLDLAAPPEAVSNPDKAGEGYGRTLSKRQPIQSAPPPERALPIEKAGKLPRSVKAGTGQAALIDRSIEKAARKYDLAPKLIKAVIRAESNFQVDALSPAGARGLMQLMPATATELGVNDSFDIDQNIDGGSRYLRQMLDRYSGNLRMALSAYNAGPGNVDKYGGRVPFAETRQYVDRVLRFSRMIA